MEENKVLVTELPLPFDEKDLEELKSARCIIDYRGDGKIVVKDGQLALSYDNYWWKKQGKVVNNTYKIKRAYMALFFYDSMCCLLDLIIFRDFTSTLYTLEDLSS